MHAEQASSSGVFEGGGGGGATGLLNKGGGSNRLPVEFPQVQTSNYNCFMKQNFFIVGAKIIIVVLLHSAIRSE